MDKDPSALPSNQTDGHNPAEVKQYLLSAIVESSDDAITSKTLKGIITSWNPAAERLFGYAENEAIGKHISMIIPDDRLSEEELIISRIAEGKKVDHFSTLRLNKNGQLISISVTISPIVNNSGDIVGASKIARDVSEQQKDIERKGMLAAIIDTSDDTILSKTLEGIITSWNKAAEKMFGYTEAETLGKHISLIIPPERLAEETYIIGEISKGNRVDHFHTVRVAKSGRLVPISVSVSPITDADGKVVGASKIARDISEQQAIQEEKAKLFEQVKALNDKKDEFIGLASHELKTPLTSINGYLQILSGMVSDERGRQFMDKARMQVKKLGTLVDDLLDISKIEAKELPLSISEFDIKQVIEDAIELISYGNNKYQITLETNVDELLISGDSHRIERVLINLLTNAIRYSPGTDRIEVYLTKENNEVKIGVRDYGVGIAADKLEHIFSRFYRVDDKNPNVSGLGIGLYLSEQIVNRHNGRIWAESEPDKGSVFWFTLPA